MNRAAGRVAGIGAYLVLLALRKQSLRLPCSDQLSFKIAKLKRLDIAPSYHDDVDGLEKISPSRAEYLPHSSLYEISHRRPFFKLGRHRNSKTA